MITSKFQVSKNTSIFFQEKGFGKLIEEYYITFFQSKILKPFPSKTKKLELKCGQTLEIFLGEKKPLDINAIALGQKSWKNIYIYPVSFKLDDKKYSGELIGYDRHLPPLSRDFSCLKSLDLEAQKWFGFEFTKS